MKSPTYILKRVYDETLQEKDYLQHICTLKNIHDKKSNIIQSTNSSSQKLDQIKLNKVQSRKFVVQQVEYNRKFENQSLHDKIDSINKQTIIHKPDPTKSLIAASQRKEQQRIMQENLRLAKRMIELPSVISKNRFETDFSHHVKDSKIMKRFHQQMGEKNKEMRDQITFHGRSKKQSIFNTTTRQSLTQTRAQSQSEAYKKEWKLQLNQNDISYVVQLRFQSVLFNNDIPKQENKIENLYLVEGKLQDKELFRSKPQNYQSFQSHELDIQLTQQQYKSIVTLPRSLEIIMWKLKNYNEINMGSFYIEEEDFDMVPDFPQITIEGSIQGSLKKLPDASSNNSTSRQYGPAWEQIQIKNLKKDILKIVNLKESSNGIIDFTMTVRNLKIKSSS